MRIDFHPDATEDLDSAVDWYLARSSTAAVRFAEAIEAALAKIHTDPERFLAVGSKFRSCAVEHFPFQIIYRIDPDRLYIIAVAHAKRRPGYWKKRL